MKKSVLLLCLLPVLFSCGKKENSASVDAEITRSFPAIGTVINPDSVEPLIVVPVDESKLVHKPAGNPVTLAVGGIVPVGAPVVVTADESALPKIVPGQDSTQPAQVTPYKDSVGVAHQPALMPALNPRMKDAASFNMQCIDVEQGLSSSYINGIEQDRRGNIWLATDGGGLVEYDGQQFRNFTPNEGMSSNGIFAVLEDSKGNLWIGTNDGGVTRYDGKNFRYFMPTSGLSNENVKTIFEDSKGNIWFGTYNGVSMFDGKKFTTYNEAQGLGRSQVFAVTEDQQGNIWLGTFGNGVFRFDGTAFTQFTSAQGINVDHVLSMLVDKTGSIWIGTLGSGVVRYRNNAFETFTTAQGLLSDVVSSMIEDHAGNIWLGQFGGGITKYDGATFTNYTLKSGLSSDAIFCMMEDDAHNLWIGTNGGGLTVFNENSFRFFTTSEGLPNNTVNATLEDRNGDLWFATNGGGVTKYDGQAFMTYTTEQGLPADGVASLFEDKEGNIWMGTSAGACRFNGKEFVHFTTNDGLADNNVQKITQDGKGNMWFATFNGVSRYDGKNFSNLTQAQGLASKTILGIIEDSKGNMWFASNVGGVMKYDGKVITVYKQQDGLKSISVFSFLEDSKGILWFGTNGGGVTRYDGINFTPYTMQDGLSNNIVWSIGEDAKGNIWLGTEKGLNCLASAPGTHDKFLPVISVFHKEDGLKAEDFYQNSVFLDNKNRMWWGSGKALTMLDMNRYQVSQIAPRVQLNSVFLNEQFLDFQHSSDSAAADLTRSIRYDSIGSFSNYPLNVVLPYDVNHVTFNFTAVDWSAPHKVKYRYKLEGLDEDWSQSTSETKADYRNIPPGEYTFQVMAQGTSGTWSDAFRYPFKVTPPWWNTWWARVMYFVLGVLCVVAIVRWNSTKLRQRAALLRQKVKEATEEISQQKHQIEEKHKEITDSINYAERIQRSLLASGELLNKNLKEHFVLFRPKDVVSGDFYWAGESVGSGSSSTVGGEKFLLCVGDSTGHGVPGAIMSILNIACIEKAVEAEKLTAPNDILNYTRSKVIDILKKDGSAEGGKDGMDCSLVQFDFVNNIMTISSANNAVWIVRGTEIIEIKADKMPVGRHEKQTLSFSKQEIATQQGDMIYLFTDGFADQFGGEEGKKFMSKNLRKLLAANAGLSMTEQKMKLENTFTAWKGTLEQVDDVCVVGVRM